MDENDAVLLRKAVNYYYFREHITLDEADHLDRVIDRMVESA